MKPSLRSFELFLSRFGGTGIRSGISSRRSHLFLMMGGSQDNSEPKVKSSERSIAQARLEFRGGLLFSFR
jgi:hypothetical protein